MDIDDYLEFYEEALENNDFVEMANLAGRMIQDLRYEKNLYDLRLDRYGVCPICRKQGDCLSVNSRQWYVCKEHKYKWFIGTNVFNTWRSMTVDEFNRNEDILMQLKRVVPLHPLVKINCEELGCGHSVNTTEQP